MKLHRATLASCLIAGVVGCAASLPGKKIDEGGRFMQTVFGDQIVSQIDMPTSGLCAAEIKATPWNSQADLKCAQVSDAKNLQFLGKAAYGNTGIELELHFRSEEQCTEFKNVMNKLDIKVVCLGRK